MLRPCGPKLLRMRTECMASPFLSCQTHRPRPLMSHVNPWRHDGPASPQTAEKCRCDDRATVGAEPRDVGQHPLIRGFTHIRFSVWGCPGLRSGVDLMIGLTGRSG